MWLILLFEIIMIMITLALGIIAILDKAGDLNMYRFIASGLDLSQIHITESGGLLLRRMLLLLAICVFLIVMFHYINDIYRRLVIIVRVNRRSLNGSAILLFILGICLSGVLAFFVSKTVLLYHNQCDIVSVREALASDRAIVHAAGGITASDGSYHIYTNSYDALQNTLAYENRYVEIDFTHAADHALLCTHYEEYRDYNADEFMEEKIDGEFIPMSLVTLADVMYSHPELIVITDIKDGNIDGLEQIKKWYPDLTDRFIAQIYHPYEYPLARKLGYRYIIYTLYDADEWELEMSNIKKTISECDLVGLTYGDYWMDEEGFFDNISDTDIPMYIHTIDNKEDIEQYLNMGFSAIYTNNTDNDWMREGVRHD